MARTISVGVSRLFRLVEVDGTVDKEKKHFRVEQAVRDPLTKKWEWRPLAMATEWSEAHGALHQMQADCMDQLRVRKGGFRVDRYT